MGIRNENVIKTGYQDKEIWIVKTAHISKTSVDDVRETVAEVQPDAICIELDQNRYESLTSRERWQNTDIATVIKEKKATLLLVNMILASFQRRMAKNLETSSGGEMLAGIEEAQKADIPIVNADRPINLTFRRIWNNLGFKEKTKLIYTIFSSLFDDEEISEEDLASLKEADALETALQDVGKEFPVVKRILIDERDAYLAQKIKTAPGKKIVAVVGAGHGQGIVRHMNEDVDLQELENTSKPKSLSWLKWLLPAAIVSMIAYTLYTNREVGIGQLKAWWLWNGCLSAIGTVLAFGHPLSVATSFLLAPLTSLNPLLAVGWFSGLVEAKLRNPKVKDFEQLGEDTQSLKGFWKNKVTRVLLVVLFANLFSTIGTFIGGADIVWTFFHNLFQ